jgi:hypothetical protein
MVRQESQVLIPGSTVTRRHQTNERARLPDTAEPLKEIAMTSTVSNEQAAPVNGAGGAA